MEKPKTVCLVDDEPEVIDGLTLNLKKNFDVKPFTSAVELVRAFEKGFAPDVVVSDLKMPQMDGLSLIDDLNKRGLRTKVIVVSGNADKKDLAKVLNCGVFGFLEKPFTGSALTKMITNAMLSQEWMMREKALHHMMHVQVSLEELCDTYQCQKILSGEIVEQSIMQQDVPIEIREAYLELKQREQMALDIVAKSKGNLNRFLTSLGWFKKIKRVS